MQIELNDRAIAKLQIAYTWETRKFAGIGKRPDFATWVQNTMNTSVAEKLCAYAEAQAEASMKRMAVQYAENYDVTILEAYSALGLRFKASGDAEASE